MEQRELTKDVDVRDTVIAHLKTIERNLRWLSIKINRPYPTMYSIFVQKTVNLSQDCLDNINEILGTNF